MLKCLKFNCFMLEREKMKCLVLSRFPHSQPPINFPWLGAYFIKPIWFSFTLNGQLVTASPTQLYY